MRVSLIIGFSAVAVGALFCQATPANATVYNVNIFGPLPEGVTRGPIASASTNACGATTCAGGYNAAYSFQAQPGDTINFGTLTLGSFIFGDGRSFGATQYVDENGQLRTAFGTPTALYYGSLGVAYEYKSFIQLNYNYVRACNSGVPNCLASLQALSASSTIELEFTLPTGFIELGWTSPSTYVPPTSIGPIIAESVPEASTWAMLLIGFAGMGFMTYRRPKSVALGA